LSGAFLIQTVLLIGASALIGGTVAPSSDTGHTLFGVRIGIGVLLLIFGVLLRRPPGKPVPEIPHALERLHQLRPGQSFIAGVVIADYQGPVIASFALAESSLGFAGRLVGLGFYSLIATGIPLLLMLWTTRSERARDRVTRATTSVMRNRRQIASWFAVIGGLLLIGDGILSLLTE
jgi:formate-dependent nitrite reductase membrane component NrfD